MHIRTTLNIDEELFRGAKRLSGLKEKTEVVHAGPARLANLSFWTLDKRLGAAARCLRVFAGPDR